MKAKIKNIIKTTLVAMLAIALGGYIVFAMIGMSGTDPEAVCESVEYIIDGEESARFVSSKDVDLMLRNSHIHPQGRKMSNIDTRKIEQLIASNDYVSSVECYKSAAGKVCIKVQQRCPILFVIPDNEKSYFVDTRGKIIPEANYTTNLVVATGEIDKKYAVAELQPFALYLNTDEFWNNQIAQVYVKRGNKGVPRVELVPRVGNHIINLGPIDDYEKKLRRMKVFYEKGISVVGWKKYAYISLEYPNQIICKKSK